MDEYGHERGYLVTRQGPLVAINSQSVRADSGFIPFLRRWVEVPEHLSRPDYEHWCRQYGVAAVPDAELGDYADRYANYDWHTYLSTAAKRRQHLGRVLRQHRWFRLLNEHREQTVERGRTWPTAHIPQPEGQLWEPCEHCGQEPVYLPLHLCDDCWPRRPVRY